MSRALIRALPIFIDGKKIAECTGGTYSIASGDEMHIATDGYIGHSDGATTVKIDPECIIPVKGMQITVDAILLGKKYVQIGVPVNGKFHQVDCRLISASYKWDAKTGSATGSFNFEGGQPEITG